MTTTGGTELTIVLGYRDRDLRPLTRCLDSLAAQSFTGFDVIFVDYGTIQVSQEELRQLVDSYPFCTYIRAETQGRPWNRAHALNIGIRRATGAYVMTSDIDFIFPRDFLARAISAASPERVIHAHVQFLRKSFARWHQLETSAGGPVWPVQRALGGCQVVAASMLHEMRGFDEYYRYWGIEDRDLHSRLDKMGLETIWLGEDTVMFHQWHPPADIKTPGFIPEGVWGRMENHYYRLSDQIVRNDDNWGQVHNRADRPSLEFIDVDGRGLAKRSDLVVLRPRVDQPRHISQMVRVFWELPSGHALAVCGAFQPRISAATTCLLRALNAGLRLTGRKPRVGYRANLVHGYLAQMIEDNASEIADYCLAFPLEDGVSILVKK